MDEREPTTPPNERSPLQPRSLVFWLGACALFALLTIVLFEVKKPRPGARDAFAKLGIEKPASASAAPDFTLNDISGAPLSLKRLRGKVVFVNFWATWCVPCREEMPAMERLHRKFKDQGLEIVAIDSRETQKDAAAFFHELGLTFKSLVDPDGSVSDAYGAWSLPLSYLIDRKGEFIGKAIGSRNWDSETAREFFHGILSVELAPSDR